MIMELQNIPKQSKIYIECSDGSKFLIFHHLDGLYSFCTTEKDSEGGVINLSRFTPLVEFEDGYKIDNSNGET